MDNTNSSQQYYYDDNGNNLNSFTSQKMKDKTPVRGVNSSSKLPPRQKGMGVSAEKNMPVTGGDSEPNRPLMHVYQNSLTPDMQRNITEQSNQSNHIMSPSTAE